MTTMAAILLVPLQAGPEVTFEFRNGASLKVEGAAPGLPENSVVDVVLERWMNRANYLQPILEKARSDMPARQLAEVSKGRFRATFEGQPPGYYILRADFLLKFQTSMKVGEAMSRGSLKEFSAEKVVFLGTTEELIDSLSKSVGPVESIAKKLLETLDSAQAPGTDPGSLSAACDKLSDEIDRIKGSSGLPGTLHALKGHAENLAQLFRGMSPAKSSRSPRHGGGGPSGDRPPGGEPGGPPSEEGNPNPGHEEGFLKPSDAARKEMNEPGSVKLGDRFGPDSAEKKTDDKPKDRTSRIRASLQEIVRLYSREIACSLLERAREIVAAGRSGDRTTLSAELARLAELHRRRGDEPDPAGKVYVEATTVGGVAMDRYWERSALYLSDKRPEGEDLAKELDDLWNRFNTEIRNRIR
jgi:hypothetical protein